MSASMEVTVKPVVPPWGRAFHGVVRVRVFQEDEVSDVNLEVREGRSLACSKQRWRAGRQACRQG